MNLTAKRTHATIMARPRCQTLYCLAVYAIVLDLVGNQILVDNLVVGASAEQLKLATIMPKLQAIHEDTKSLLIKNKELKNKILIGLQAQNEAKLKHFKEPKLSDIISSGLVVTSQAAPTTTSPTSTQTSQPQQTTASLPRLPLDNNNNNNGNQDIDYAELDDFNRWVDVNLEYAVKNTQASADALKEEAAQNNGNVEYSEQAIKDGIEGVKYWQSAVIFQDKTLKHEKFEID